MLQNWLLLLCSLLAGKLQYYAFLLASQKTYSLTVSLAKFLPCTILEQPVGGAVVTLHTTDPIFQANP